MYLVQSQVQEHFHQFSTHESGGAIQRLVDHRFSFKITLVNLYLEFFYVAWGPSCDGEKCGYICIYKNKKYRREGLEPARGTHS
jgi:hypothetical protein